MRRVGLAVLLVFLFGLAPSSLTASNIVLQSDTILLVDPPAIDVSAYDSFSVDVVVHDVVDLVGFEFY